MQEVNRNENKERHRRFDIQMSEDFEKVELLFALKCSKYADSDLDERLKDILFHEALKEVMAANHIRSKIRS